MIAVTCFGPDGYELYGRKCLQTLDANFPGRVIAYYEEKPIDAPSSVELRDFFEIPNAKRFLERIKSVANSDGQTPSGFDFRYNANIYCRKVFAQDAVFDEDEFVFWIDADSVVFRHIPEDFLLDLVKDVPFAYLGRENALGAQAYTETGFLGFNTKHPDFAKFRANYLPYFTTGRIFSQLKGWHDCIAFDHARQGIKGNNLTPDGRGMNHVLLHSVLAKYIDHLKGARKGQGHSDGHPANWWLKTTPSIGQCSTTE